MFSSAQSAIEALRPFDPQSAQKLQDQLSQTSASSYAGETTNTAADNAYDSVGSNDGALSDNCNTPHHLQAQEAASVDKATIAACRRILLTDRKRGLCCLREAFFQVGKKRQFEGDLQQILRALCTGKILRESILSTCK